MPDANDKPVVNFAVLKSVEDYVQKSGKFRTNCASFNIPGRDSGGAKTAYFPYCDKQRFDFGKHLNDYRAHGIFTPAEKGERWQITDFMLYREHFHDIHCPPACRGYRHKTVAAILSTIRRLFSTGRWTSKEIATAVVVPVVICLAGGLLGWLTPEGRRLLHLDKQPSEIPSGSIVNNGGIINNPTINNGASGPKGSYELSNEQRDRFLNSLSALKTPSRDRLRIGCTTWSEASCVAAGRFLLLLSEAGWQIEENRVFRVEPQIPIVGVSIVTHTPAGEPNEALAPHLGRWRLMDESHKTIYWAFHSIDIPVGGSTDDSLKDGTLGIYFGSEPK